MSHDPHTITWLLIVAVVALVAAFLLPWWVVMLGCIAALVPALMVSSRIRRALRSRAKVGAESLPGAQGIIVARTPEASLPYVVRLGGEIWSARSPERLSVGEQVLVLGVEDNHLVICQLPAELQPPW
jgi:inner membrane protein